MSTGKYSPICPHSDKGWEFFKYNSYGETPIEWNRGSGIPFDDRTMLDNYDSEGFDSYGYSDFDIDGKFVGSGSGVDRYGYTEMDYLTDSANGGNLYYDIQSYGTTVLKDFKRER